MLTLNLYWVWIFRNGPGFWILDDATVIARYMIKAEYYFLQFGLYMIWKVRFLCVSAFVNIAIKFGSAEGSKFLFLGNYAGTVSPMIKK